MAERALPLQHDAGINAGEKQLAGAYADLKELAVRYLRRERRGHTLQPTALVHEAFLRLRRQRALGHLDQGKLIGLAARTMRIVLVDHARRRNAQKRGGHAPREPLDDMLVVYEDHALDIIALHEALERLSAIDSRMTEIIDRRFFAGLSEEETAAGMGISASTVRREWRLARNWLWRALHAGEDGAGDMVP